MSRETRSVRALRGHLPIRLQRSEPPTRSERGVRCRHAGRSLWLLIPQRVDKAGHAS